MRSKSRTPETISDYIAGFPPEVRRRLKAIRKTIRKAAPAASETISYGIPTFRGTRNLVHFAAYENHIGLYPAPREAEEFGDELARYAGGKGTVRFPLDEPVPLGLVRRIVRFRVERDAPARKAKKPRASRRAVRRR